MTEYLQQANDSLLTMVQIETKEALEAVDEIAAVPGVDVLFVGPFDLGRRALVMATSKSSQLTSRNQGNNIGYPILNGVMDPALDEAIAKILAAAKAAGKKTGIFCTSGEQSKAYADLGFDMISVATDVTALQQTLRESLSIARGGAVPEKTGSY
jgi:4-hydroxy-2-oxoheptanedioate aldolase